MIVRILGEGQRVIHASELDGLNSLDGALVVAVDSGDEDAFADACWMGLAISARLGASACWRSRQSSRLL